MKKDMPLEGLRWSRDSGSALYDTPPNGRSRTGWGGNVWWCPSFYEPRLASPVDCPRQAFRRICNPSLKKVRPINIWGFVIPQ